MHDFKNTANDTSTVLAIAKALGTTADKISLRGLTAGFDTIRSFNSKGELVGAQVIGSYVSLTDLTKAVHDAAQMLGIDDSHVAIQATIAEITFRPVGAKADVTLKGNFTLSGADLQQLMLSGRTDSGNLILGSLLNGQLTVSEYKQGVTNKLTGLGGMRESYVLVRSTDAAAEKFLEMATEMTFRTAGAKADVTIHGNFTLTGSDLSSLSLQGRTDSGNLVMGSLRNGTLSVSEYRKLDTARNIPGLGGARQSFELVRSTDAAAEKFLEMATEITIRPRPSLDDLLNKKSPFESSDWLSPAGASSGQPKEKVLRGNFTLSGSDLKKLNLQGQTEDGHVITGAFVNNAFVSTALSLSYMTKNGVKISGLNVAITDEKGEFVYAQVVKQKDVEAFVQSATVDPSNQNSVQRFAEDLMYFLTKSAASFTREEVLALKPVLTIEGTGIVRLKLEEKDSQLQVQQLQWFSEQRISETGEKIQGVLYIQQPDGRYTAVEIAVKDLTMDSDLIGALRVKIREAVVQGRISDLEGMRREIYDNMPSAVRALLSGDASARRAEAKEQMQTIDEQIAQLKARTFDGQLKLEIEASIEQGYQKAMQAVPENLPVNYEMVDKGLNAGDQSQANRLLMDFGVTRVTYHLRLGYTDFIHIDDALKGTSILHGTDFYLAAYDQLTNDSFVYDLQTRQIVSSYTSQTNEHKLYKDGFVDLSRSGMQDSIKKWDFEVKDGKTILTISKLSMEADYSAFMILIPAVSYNERKDTLMTVTFEGASQFEMNYLIGWKSVDNGHGLVATNYNGQVTYKVDGNPMGFHADTFQLSSNGALIGQDVDGNSYALFINKDGKGASEYRFAEAGKNINTEYEFAYLLTGTNAGRNVTKITDSAVYQNGYYMDKASWLAGGMVKVDPATLQVIGTAYQGWLQHTFGDTWYTSIGDGLIGLANTVGSVLGEVVGIFYNPWYQSSHEALGASMADMAQGFTYTGSMDTWGGWIAGTASKATVVTTSLVGLLHIIPAVGHGLTLDAYNIIWDHSDFTLGATRAAVSETVVGFIHFAGEVVGFVYNLGAGISNLSGFSNWAFRTQLTEVREGELSALISVLGQDLVNKGAGAVYRDYGLGGLLASFLIGSLSYAWTAISPDRQEQFDTFRNQLNDFALKTPAAAGWQTIAGSLGNAIGLVAGFALFFKTLNAISPKLMMAVQRSIHTFAQVAFGPYSLFLRATGLARGFGAFNVEMTLREAGFFSKFESIPVIGRLFAWRAGVLDRSLVSIFERYEAFDKNMKDAKTIEPFNKAVQKLTDAFNARNAAARTEARSEMRAALNNIELGLTYKPGFIMNSIGYSLEERQARRTAAENLTPRQAEIEYMRLKNSMTGGGIEGQARLDALGKRFNFENIETNNTGLITSVQAVNKVVYTAPSAEGAAMRPISSEQRPTNSAMSEEHRAGRIARTKAIDEGRRVNPAFSADEAFEIGRAALSPVEYDAYLRYEAARAADAAAVPSPDVLAEAQAAAQAARPATSRPVISLNPLVYLAASVGSRYQQIESKVKQAADGVASFLNRAKENIGKSMAAREQAFELQLSRGRAEVIRFEVDSVNIENSTIARSRYNDMVKRYGADHLEKLQEALKTKSIDEVMASDLATVDRVYEGFDLVKRSVAQFARETLGFAAERVANSPIGRSTTRNIVEGTQAFTGRRTTAAYERVSVREQDLNLIKQLSSRYDFARSDNGRMTIAERSSVVDAQFKEFNINPKTAAKIQNIASENGLNTEATKGLFKAYNELTSGDRRADTALQTIQRSVVENAGGNWDSFARQNYGFEYTAPLNRKAYQMMEKVIQLSGNRDLVRAYDASSAKQMAKVYSRLSEGERIFLNAVRFKESAPGYFLMVKQLAGIRALRNYHIEAGTGSGKTNAILGRAAEDINQMNFGKQNLDKGAVIYEVPNQQGVEQIIGTSASAIRGKAFVEAASYGKAQLVDGRPILKMVEEGRIQDAIAELNKTNIIVIDKDTAGFIRARSPEVMKRLEHTIRYVDEGDASLLRARAHVMGSEGTETIGTQEYFRMNQRTDDLAQQFIQEGRIRVETDFHKFLDELHSSKAVVFHDLAKYEVIVNEATTKLFTEDPVLRNGVVSSEGIRYDGATNAEIKSALEAHLAPREALEHLRDVVLNETKTGYVAHGRGSILGNEVPGDAQFLLSLNRARRNAGLEFVEFDNKIGVLDTHGGVPRVAGYRIAGNNARVRLISATTGEVANLAEAYTGAKVYDIETGRLLGGKDGGQSVHDIMNRYDAAEIFVGSKAEIQTQHLADLSRVNHGEYEQAVHGASNLAIYDEYNSALREKANELLIREGLGSTIREVVGSKTSDAAKIEEVVTSVQEGPKNILADLAGARGNDYQADLNIFIANQRLTSGELGQALGRGGRTKALEGGTFDAFRKIYVEREYLEAQFKDFEQKRQFVLDFVNNHPRISENTKALFEKVSKMTVEQTLSGEANGGLNSVELLKFRSEYNLIRDRSESALGSASELLSYTSLNEPIRQASAYALEHKLSNQYDRLTALEKELWRHGRPSEAEVFISNEPLSASEVAQRTFDHTLQRASQFYQRFLSGEAAKGWDPKIMEILKNKFAETQKMSGQKVADINISDIGGQPVSIATARTLEHAAEVVKKLTEDFAPSNRTSKAVEKELVSAITEKREAMKTFEKRFNEARTSAAKVDLLFREALPLVQGLYLIGAAYNDERNRLVEFAKQIDADFGKNMQAIANGFGSMNSKIDKELNPSVVAMNDYLFTHGYGNYISIRKSEDHLLISTYAVSDIISESLPTSSGEETRVAGLNLRRIDGLSKEYEAPLDAAQSLGNFKYVLLFESKTRQIVEEQYYPVASGQKENRLNVLKADLNALVDNTGSAKYLSFTDKGFLAYNHKLHEAEFGEEGAERLGYAVSQANLILQRAFDMKTLNPQDARGIRELAFKSFDDQIENAATQRKVFEAELGVHPSLDDVTRVMGRMLLSHEFTHEFHHLTIGDEYNRTPGSEKEFIAHLGPIAKGHNGLTVLVQLQDYLANAPDTDDWKSSYKEPAIEIFNGFARLAGISLTIPPLEKFNQDKERNLKNLNQLVDKLTKLEPDQLKAYATELLADKGIQFGKTQTRFGRSVREELKRYYSPSPNEHVALYKFSGSDTSSNIFLATFRSVEGMHDALGRIQQHFESDPTMKTPAGQEAKRATGHDYRASDLAAYFSTQPLNDSEKEFKEFLVKNRVIEIDSKGRYAGRPDVAVLALSHETLVQNPQLFEETVEHEVLGHGIHFTDGRRDIALRRIWNGLTSRQQEAFAQILGLIGYNTKDQQLVLTEFGAYMRDSKTLITDLSNAVGSDQAKQVLAQKLFAQLAPKGESVQKLLQTLEGSLRALDPPLMELGRLVRVDSTTRVERPVSAYQDRINDLYNKTFYSKRYTALRAKLDLLGFSTSSLIEAGKIRMMETFRKQNIADPQKLLDQVEANLNTLEQMIDYAKLLPTAGENPSIANVVQAVHDDRQDQYRRFEKMGLGLLPIQFTGPRQHTLVIPDKVFTAVHDHQDRGEVHDLGKENIPGLNLETLNISLIRESELSDPDKFYELLYHETGHANTVGFDDGRRDEGINQTATLRALEARGIVSGRKMYQSEVDYVKKDLEPKLGWDRVQLAHYLGDASLLEIQGTGSVAVETAKLTESVNGKLASTLRKDGELGLLPKQAANELATLLEKGRLSADQVRSIRNIFDALRGVPGSDYDNIPLDAKVMEQFIQDNNLDHLIAVKDLKNFRDASPLLANQAPSIAPQESTKAVPTAIKEEREEQWTPSESGKVDRALADQYISLKIEDHGALYDNNMRSYKTAIEDYNKAVNKSGPDTNRIMTNALTVANESLTKAIENLKAIHALNPNAMKFKGQDKSGQEIQMTLEQRITELGSMKSDVESGLQNLKQIDIHLQSYQGHMQSFQNAVSDYTQAANETTLDLERMRASLTKANEFLAQAIADLKTIRAISPEAISFKGPDKSGQEIQMTLIQKITELENMQASIGAQLKTLSGARLSEKQDYLTRLNDQARQNPELSEQDISQNQEKIALIGDVARSQAEPLGDPARGVLAHGVGSAGAVRMVSIILDGKIAALSVEELAARGFDTPEAVSPAVYLAALKADNLEYGPDYVIVSGALWSQMAPDHTLPEIALKDVRFYLVSNDAKKAFIETAVREAVNAGLLSDSDAQAQLAKVVSLEELAGGRLATPEQILAAISEGQIKLIGSGEYMNVYSNGAVVYKVLKSAKKDWFSGMKKEIQAMQDAAQVLGYEVIEIEGERYVKIPGLLPIRYMFDSLDRLVIVQPETQTLNSLIKQGASDDEIRALEEKLNEGIQKLYETVFTRNLIRISDSHKDNFGVRNGEVELLDNNLMRIDNPIRTHILINEARNLLGGEPREPEPFLAKQDRRPVPRVSPSSKDNSGARPAEATTQITPEQSSNAKLASSLRRDGELGLLPKQAAEELADLVENGHLPENQVRSITRIFDAIRNITGSSYSGVTLDPKLIKQFILAYNLGHQIPEQDLRNFEAASPILAKRHSYLKSVPSGAPAPSLPDGRQAAGGRLAERRPPLLQSYTNKFKPSGRGQLESLHQKFGGYVDSQTEVTVEYLVRSGTQSERRRIDGRVTQANAFGFVTVGGVKIPYHNITGVRETKRQIRMPEITILPSATSTPTVSKPAPIVPIADPQETIDLLGGTDSAFSAHLSVSKKGYHTFKTDPLAESLHSSIDFEFGKLTTAMQRLAESGMLRSPYKYKTIIQAFEFENVKKDRAVAIHISTGYVDYSGRAARALFNFYLTKNQYDRLKQILSQTPRLLEEAIKKRSEELGIKDDRFNVSELFEDPLLIGIGPDGKAGIGSANIQLDAVLSSDREAESSRLKVIEDYRQSLPSGARLAEKVAGLTLPTLEPMTIDKTINQLPLAGAQLVAGTAMTPATLNQAVLAEALRNSFNQLPPQAVEAVLSGSTTLPDYMEVVLKANGVKDESVLAEIRTAAALIEQKLETLNIEDLVIRGQYFDAIDVEKLLADVKISDQAFRSILIAVANDYAFISGLKRLIASTGASKGSMFLHADLLVVDGRLNQDALKVIRAMSASGVLTDKSFAIVVSEEQERFMDEFKASGADVMRADDLASLENSTQGRGYTIATGESKTGFNFTKGILEDSRENANKVVVAGSKLTQELVRGGKGYYVLYMAYQAHYAPEEAKRATFIDNPENFSKDFRDLINTYFAKGLVRIIKAPWEALTSLYRAIRATAVAA